MRKLLISLFLLVLIVPVNAAFNPKFGIDLKGDFGLMNPAHFNADYTGVFKNGFGIATVTGTEITDNLSGSINLDWFVAGNFALFFRSDFIYIDTSDKLVPEGTETEVIDSRLSLNTGYFGLGAKVYATLSDIFVPYLSVDAGLFTQFGSFWEVWADPANTVGVPVDATNQYSSVDITDSFFGAHAELGFEFLFFSFWGLNAGAGYRYAPAVITYPTAGIFAYTNPDGTKVFTAETLDMSGIYFGGGLSFYFGMEPVKPAAGQAGAAAQQENMAPGDILSDKYEKAGDKYYADGNYDYALRYFAGALKSATKVDALIYKKIGFTYLKLKNKKKAVYYLELYTQYTPSDTKMIEWVNKNKGK